MRTLGAAVLLLTATACVHRIPPPFAPEAAHLRVHLHVPRTGPVTVHLHLDAVNWPGPAVAKFAELPDSHLSALSPRPELNLPTGAGLDVTYEVNIPRVDATTEGPALAAAFDTPTGRHLQLNALVPIIQSAAHADRMAPIIPALIEVDSELPLTSSLAGAAGLYWATTPTEFYHGVVLAGRVAEATGSSGVTLASFDFDEAALERLASLEKRAAAVLERSHGARVPLNLVVVHREPVNNKALGLAGINGGAAIAMFSKGIPDGRPTSETGNVLLHELVHSYQPPDKALPHWITEGFTEYFAHRLALSLDGFADEALYGGMEDLWDAFVRTTPGRRASESALGDYFGGAVLAFCIDARLRRDHSSLEAVLSRTRRRANGAVSNALWEQEIAFTSASAGALVLNAKTEPIDPVQLCFKEAGLAHVDGALAVSESYAAKQLGIRSVQVQPRHYDVVVAEPSAGGPLRPEDAVVSVGGQRIENMGALREALYAAAQKGPTAVVQISRDGVLETLTVPLNAAGPGAPARRMWRKP